MKFFFKCKNSFFYFSLCCFLVLLIFVNQQLRNRIATEISSMELLGMERDLLLDNYSLHYKYNEQKFHDVPLISENDELINLSDLLDTDYKIFFKFSYLHCSTCITSVLTELSHYQTELKYDNVIILASYDNKRSFLAFKQNNPIPFQMYFINEKEDTNAILVNENMPYIGIMNKDMVIRDLFIPMKELPSFMKRYIRQMRNKYPSIGA